MVDIQDDAEWRQTQHRIHRAEIVCVLALGVLTVLTVLAGYSDFVR
ncbi:malonyl CoA-acyl carrier protein transacylase [Arthrobacter sp. PvP102]|nr:MULTISPECIES: hypothetical protein [unclassified Arthrobacter]MBP1234751.1 malonyl CoA-acyl carrier protein transacylase [Arthrobacter sp. PvP103]MBP1235709.1 malonyl CoA-acyl carrier protein transacylase [Arthrobacter sp. PvP102]